MGFSFRRFNTYTVKEDPVTKVEYIAIQIKSKGALYEMKIDFQDFNVLNHNVISLSSAGYALQYRNGKLHRLHRLLLNPGDLQVDHINHDKLDNRRSNLRIVTHRENQHNKKMYVNGRQPGVSRRGNKYRAYINVDNTRYYLGDYHTYEEAVQAYKKKLNEIR